MATKPPAVTILCVALVGGGQMTVAVSRSDPTKGYEVRCEGGHWLCACISHAYRGDCAHARSASANHAPVRHERKQVVLI